MHRKNVQLGAGGLLAVLLSAIPDVHGLFAVCARPPDSFRHWWYDGSPALLPFVALTAIQFLGQT